MKRQRLKWFVFFLICWIMSPCWSQIAPDNNYVKDHFTKIDTTITMRDGIQLYTILYIPKDHSEKYPFLMERTPYSVAPYGKDNFTKQLGPNKDLMRENYIFVYQDVRGRYMSEGINLEVTPFIPDKKNKQQVDESTDTYDTVDWLIKKISGNNGRVGLYGISYPGFYATASLPNAHPAIKAVSPQAPVTDEFIGDDANHNGAFFLMDNFFFMNYFGKGRTGPTMDYGDELFKVTTNDAYQFFLNLGPLKNTQSPAYFNHESYIWNEYLEHDTYDTYWKSRNIRKYLNGIKVPTLVVGGWFDAEDLFGALHTFEALEKQSPDNKNYLVMGPWTHGAWARNEWTQFGTYNFGSNTNQYYRDSIETPFFNYFLKDKGSFNRSKATVFETGSNVWQSYPTWPLNNTYPVTLYLKSDRNLSFEGKSVPSTKKNSYDEYVSSPSNPVPYTAKKSGNRNNEYMVEDQRFAANRTDVLSYETPVLKKDLSVAGEIQTKLFVSTTGTDADFIVKLIEVIPADEMSISSDIDSSKTGFQRLVRAEVIRGKFRKSYEHPEPFVPGQVTEVNLKLNAITHTFKKGHKIMVQVQSSWFPLVDRNPQQFMKIPLADEKDFINSTIRIYYDELHLSRITIPVTP